MSCTSRRLFAAYHILLLEAGVFFLNAITIFSRRMAVSMCCHCGVSSIRSRVDIVLSPWPKLTVVEVEVEFLLATDISQRVLGGRECSRIRVKVETIG